MKVKTVAKILNNLNLERNGSCYLYNGSWIKIASNDNVNALFVVIGKMDELSNKMIDDVDTKKFIYKAKELKEFLGV